MFGGTFDPVHVGHMVAAVNARHALGLDRLLLVVANLPWQKSDRRVTPAEDRFAMVEAAVAGHQGLEASRLELDRGGVTYTADTLEALAAPDRELFLVVGRDVGSEMGTWVRPEVVQRLATLAVVDRPDAPEPALGPNWRVERVAIPLLQISGSDLRQRAADGRPLDWLVPEAAMTVIVERGLYAGGR